MPAPDVFRHDEWHDFLPRRPMSGDRNADGMISVFVICSPALMGGQGHAAIGAEWATVAAMDRSLRRWIRSGDPEG